MIQNALIRKPSSMLRSELFWMLGALGFLFYWTRKNKSAKSAKGWEREFTGAYPAKSGAFNAVVSGHPEDLNEMPATGFEGVDFPIYDGSDLRH